MQKLNKEFYLQTDVSLIARSLLGKVIVSNINNHYTAARIVETEAYAGIIDRASHAYNEKRTRRTEVMYSPGGVAYVYLCYGIHHMFNIVTNKKEVPDAVLIRGVEPLEGMKWMLQRFNKTKPDDSIGRGPGNAGKSLGIITKHSGCSLFGDELFIADDGYATSNMMVSKRIGIDYAGKHSQWLYRFFIDQHPQVTPHPYNKTAIKLL
jgi:DNA-3-methyladenine glycosylase